MSALVLRPVHEAEGWPVPASDAELGCSVTLTRAHPSDCGFRQVFARIDGGPRIALVYGDVVNVEVRPGPHLLTAHNTLYRKRLEFTIESSEHLEFELVNSARWWTAGLAGLLGAAPLFLEIREVRFAKTTGVTPP